MFIIGNKIHKIDPVSAVSDGRSMATPELPIKCKCRPRKKPQTANTVRGLYAKLMAVTNQE